jgi:hypothetical protein
MSNVQTKLCGEKFDVKKGKQFKMFEIMWQISDVGERDA